MADSDDDWGDWAACERLRAAQEPVFGASTLCSAGSRPEEAMGVREEQGEPSSASSAKAAAPGARTEPSLHVKLLREKKAKEQARKVAAKQQREGELVAARTLLAQPTKHRRLTDEEKAARKEARRLVRANEGPKRRKAGPRTGDTEVARGHELQAVTTKGRGPLCNERSLQQTLEQVGEVLSSSSD